MAEGAGGDDATDRTEAATPRRQEKAREDGQVALSREAVGFSALLLGVLAAATALPAQGGDMLRALRGLMARSHVLGWADVLPELGQVALLAILPVAGFTALGAVAATMAQTRGLVSGKSMVPALSKLSPLAGMKRLLGPDGLLELLRTLLKLSVVGAALWWVAGSSAPLRASVHLSAGALLELVSGLSLRLITAALAVLAAIAVLDLLLVRIRHMAKLKMSRQELKEEYRETEGDPAIKARIKALRQQTSRTRMMAQVPKAAVVVTNPTHYAVALAYDQDGGGAPRVVAKGADAMAARIRETATDAGVPLVANPPLARALYKLELEAEIPAEHYQAVAEIIAFVWRARGRSPASGP
ncbi:EscU/YscU/HrcU family type III secretion system export apparatus switch protein [Humitalea sp. 24SJ18S-53]|uniref:EscU/YscU/HrcU family type III secretion system export apparatus switch protein n=1 Tax=Humitalea sp. 24SJ18S-53 TaxID=3422307 RepID=UPI003D67179B